MPDLHLLEGSDDHEHFLSCYDDECPRCLAYMGRLAEDEAAHARQSGPGKKPQPDLTKSVLQRSPQMQHNVSVDVTHVTRSLTYWFEKVRCVSQNWALFRLFR